MRQSGGGSPEEPVDVRRGTPSCSVWLAVAAGGVFVALALLASAYRTVPGDRAIGRWVQALPGPPPEVAADSSNLLGDPLSSSLIVLVLLVLCLVRRFGYGIVLCAAVLASCLVGGSLKLVFGSARPGPAEALIRDDHFIGVGFPSAHSLVVTLFAGAVTLIVPALYGRTRRVLLIVTASWIWAVVCMISRIWLGAHWFTDVAGGVALGVALLALSDKFARRYGPAVARRWTPRRSTGR